MARLWRKFSGGDRWMINTPRLLLINKGKGKSIMARRRRRRRNPANPRRRRRYNPIANLMGNRRRRRSYRRNPPNGGQLDILGVKFPGLQSVAMGTVGFLGPPIIEGYLGPMLPANIASNQGGRYLIKIGSSLGLVWAASAMMGRDAAVKVGMGAGIYIAASLVNDFMPTLTGATYPRAAYYPRLAAQPMLGDYGRTPSVTGSAPERLRPQARY